MIILIVVGSLLLVLVSAIISSQFLVPYVPLVSPSPVIAGYIGYYAGILSLFVIPILLLGKWLINYAFSHRSNHQFRKVMSGFWLVSFVAFVGTVIFSSKNFAYNTKASEISLSADIDTAQTLTVNFNSLQLEDDWKQLRLGHASLENGNLYVDNDAIDIRFTPSDSNRLEINKRISSYGRNKRRAQRNTSQVDHNISMTDQVLDIDDFYTIQKRGKYRLQKLDYNIQVPVGTKMKISNVPQELIGQRIFHQRIGNTYIMTKDGPIVLDKIKES